MVSSFDLKTLGAKRETISLKILNVPDFLLFLPPASSGNQLLNLLEMDWLAATWPAYWRLRVIDHFTRFLA